MGKLEQVLCQSWSRSCLPIDYQNYSSSGDAHDAHNKKNYEWENSLISFGCAFIRDARTTPNVPVGFVLAKHPKNQFFKSNICDFCLIPQGFALKITALEYLPNCC